MSDLFGTPPPAPPTAAKRQRRPATERQVAQAVPHTENLPDLPTCFKSQVPAEPEPPPIEQPPRLYSLVTLHDGRQVDSGSPEWRLECLASTLLQIGESERYEWIRGYGTPAAQVELRLLVGAIKAARRRRV